MQIVEPCLQIVECVLGLLFWLVSVYGVFIEQLERLFPVKEKAGRK